MATAAINSETKKEILYISAADVQIKPIRWLWEGFLPLGKFTLLVGPQGVGKTTLAFDIAGRVTKGADWPDGSKGTRPRDVYIWSAEDDHDDTMVPRLMAANADLKRIRFPDKTKIGNKTQSFDPSQDIEILHSDLRSKKSDVGLIILDPILSAINGDMNTATHVRSSLQPLIDLGRGLGVAIIGITHPAKPSAGNPRSVVDNVIGSQAFTALPRMVWAANWSQQHDAHCLAKAKQNITTSGGIKYSIAPAQVVDQKTKQRVFITRVEWGNTVKGSADEIFHVKREDTETRDAERQNPAEDFLLRELPKGEEKPAKPLIALAAERGISQDQLTRARGKLGITSRKDSDKAFYWSWPAEETDHPEERTPIAA